MKGSNVGEEKAKVTNVKKDKTKEGIRMK